MKNSTLIVITLCLLAFVGSGIYTCVILIPNMYEQQSKYISSCKNHGFLYDAEKFALPMPGWCYYEYSNGIRIYLMWNSDTDSWSVNR